MFDVQGMLATLPIAVKGMAGVFSVIIAIWISIVLMIKIFK
ncbi:MAG TPA: hypothetical protein PKK63_02075 [Bacillota bacterium]|nr:MAG: hypothetical protein BWY00_01520 [Firmicutes bacterium ADurb.Bin153]HNV34300.1 hypothetical protein [Bacillota bacterium]HPU95824.1 hypothetical protein [Bacillota bacterium]